MPDRIQLKPFHNKDIIPEDAELMPLPKPKKRVEHEPPKDPKYFEIEDIKPMQLYHPEKEYSFFDHEIKGLSFLALHSDTRKKTILIIPGDTASAQTYKQLARSLYKKGYNVFIMNYTNFPGCRSIPAKNVTIDTYQKDLADIMGYIHRSSPNNEIILFGHSRGGQVVQKYLETAARPQKVILFNSVYDKNFGQPPMSPKLMQNLIPNKTNDAVKLTRPYHEERFFEKGQLSTATIDEIYASSAEIPLALAMAPVDINYSAYRPGNSILVMSSKSDQALPLEYQKKCFTGLQAKLGNRSVLQQNELPGSHFSCIERVDETAQQIDTWIKKLK